MEDQLHEGGALNVLALDVFDAGDVEKVVLEIIGEVSFHLLRVHAAVWLCNIDRRSPQIRKDVHRHASQGEECAKCDGNYGNKK